VTYFLDTNVFLYAAGGDHPQQKPCQGILRRVAEGDLKATTSSEVVQEILYVLSRRGLRDQAIALARNITGVFPTMLEVGGREMGLACDLLESNPELPPRDAVHAAIMITHEVLTIVTADPHFDHLARIRRIAPDEV
jgi:predicted nucleic acid-binding protein